MGFAPTTPDNKNVPNPAQVAKDIDDWRIDKIVLRPGANEGVSGVDVQVHYACGYVDTGTFYRDVGTSARLNGATIEADLGANADAGKSIMKNVMDAVWASLVTDGAVPAGTVS